jgi:YbgC/YbaW family acyl-CoA thioester hydrolase
VAARHRVRLSYGDTDAAGIIYFAAWFPWMERLSTGWFYDNGFRFDRMLDQLGATMVSRATSCEYLVPVGAYDEVDIEMRVARVGERSCELAFAMTRVTDARPVGRSTLTLVAIDASGRPTPVPEPLRELLGG